MKKILLVTIDFWPKLGGVANYYWNLCRHLPSDKIVVLTDKSLKHESIKALKHDIVFSIFRKKLIVNWLWPKWLSMMWHVWRAVNKEKIEIFWVGEVLPTGTAIYLLTRIFKLPYVISCHGKDLLMAKSSKRKEKIARKILQNAKFVMVNSKYTGELIKYFGVEGKKIRVVYPGIEIRNLWPRCASADGRKSDIMVRDDLIKKYYLLNKKIIFSIGRLVERKGFDMVIEAMEKISKERPEAVYLIAGEGGDRERLEEIKNQQSTINNSVIFLGKISDEEKWALMELCNVFVMPVRENCDDAEGFGIVYLEAGSAGKPVVAGRSGGADEAVVDGTTGFLVDPLKPDEIAGAIIRILNDKELAEKMGRQGRIRVEKEFLWEQRKKIMEEIF